jgi:hypothetical protein
MGGPRSRSADGVTARRPPEPCVFVIWASARKSEHEILEDLRTRFTLADVVELRWAADEFSRNLTRLYGEALPQGSGKERECGVGHFVVAVAVDIHPRYGLRPTTRGVRRVNIRAAAAKRRYRRWTGGGFRIHGSLDRHEAERDLQLLLGLGAESVVDRRWDGVVRTRAGGHVQWDRVDDLIAAVAAATPASLEADDGETIVLRTEDVWWAAVIAGADPPAADAGALELRVSVGGSERLLRLEPLLTH